MAVETVLPGGVAGFLGLGGLVIAGLRAVGLLMDPWTAVITWVFLSVGLTIALRPLAMRFVQGEISLDLTDEDAEAMGQTVKVVAKVSKVDFLHSKLKFSIFLIRSKDIGELFCLQHFY